LKTPLRSCYKLRNNSSQTRQSSSLGSWVGVNWTTDARGAVPFHEHARKFCPTSSQTNNKQLGPLYLFLAQLFNLSVPYFTILNLIIVAVPTFEHGVPNSCVPAPPPPTSVPDATDRISYRQTPVL
jgi:hypothetical protein